MARHSYGITQHQHDRKKELKMQPKPLILLINKPVPTMEKSLPYWEQRRD